jgi:hypothetical protein
MAVIITVEVSGVDEKKYDAIMKELGLDKQGAEWPKGILSHVAGKTPEGMLVVDVWESEETFAKFRDAKLVPAFGKVGGMPEPKVKSVKVHYRWTGK